MRIREQLVSARDRTYAGINPCEWITVHETDNTDRGANAARHADLQSSGNVRQASWHEQVDDVEAVISFPPDVQCWHAGDGEGPGNLTSYAFELCVNADGDYDQALANLAARIRQRRADFGLGRDRVVQHDHWSGKDCPRLLRGMGPAAWDAFVASTDPEENTSMVTFVSPLEGRSTSPWGWRERHPVTGVRGFHRGGDIAPPKPGQTDCPFYATQDGVVRYAGGATRPSSNGTWPRNPITGTWNTGTCIVIDYDTGETGFYGHPAKIFVAPGQRVRAGDLLGIVGAVGNVRGEHVHYERWEGRVQGGGNGSGNTIDPRVVFARHGVKVGSRPIFPKNPSDVPSPDKTPVSPIAPKDWFDMATKTDLADVVREELRRDRAIQNEQLHNAMRNEVAAGASQIMARIAQIPTVTKNDVERIRLAILGDKHPAMPGTDFRGLQVSTYRDLQKVMAGVEALGGALAATNGGGESFDIEKFLTGLNQRIDDRLSTVTDEVISNIDVGVTVGKKEN